MDFSQWVSGAAARTPGKTAIRSEGRELSYRELEHRVAALAGILRRSGVIAGDRVAYLGPNCPELLETLFACARLGAIFVPLNVRMPAAELRVFAAQAGPRLLVAEESLAQTAGECAGPGQIEVLVFSVGQRWDGPPVSTAAHAGGSLPALIAYTSGTSGMPKGAVLTHEAIIANAEATARVLAMTAADEVLTFTPMFHIAGLNLLTMPALSIGATVTVHRRFDPAAVHAEIARGTVTLLVSPPHLTFELSVHPAWAHTDLTGLRCVITGGTTVPARAVDCWTSRGVAVAQGYGQTETAGNVTLVPIAEAPAKSMTGGRPMPGCDVRIIGPSGRAMAPGEQGEITVRSPSLMRGYWRNPQATAEVLHGGWLRTGDLGFLDADGYLHVIDRIKEIIIVGTSNVVPADLEAVLADSPDLAAVAVVGRPDLKLGEVPVAFVVAAAGCQPSAEQVLALFEGRIAPYKQPRDVIFLDAMPQTSVGKPEKKILRALAACEPGSGPGPHAGSG
ncbi:MAG TPA: AMP-binding protein [Streptosporangiaceae bacterium]|nr:AMP-binding protein [Streptosporangiaceae bacterium]